MKKFWVEIKIRFGKNLCPKIFWVQNHFEPKNAGPKKLLDKKNFPQNKFRVRKKFWSQKLLGLKNFLVQENAGL